MEKDFIYSNRLIKVEFYSTTIRLDVVNVDGSPFIWIVTKRSVLASDSETWSFKERSAAFSKFQELVEGLNSSLFNSITE